VSIANGSDWTIARDFAVRERKNGSLKIQIAPRSNCSAPGPGMGRRSTERIKHSPKSSTRGFGGHLGETGNIRWQKGELLGQGSFGKVYSGLDIKTGRLIAVKQVQIGKSDDEEKEMANLEKEVQLLQLLDHPNIIKYLGTERGPGTLNIFLEYAPGGSIKGVINTYGPFSESVIRRYVNDIVSGLIHLHAEGIIHRDLKPANMLLEISGTCKLSDFGCSKIIADVLGMMHSEVQHTAIGTMQFMAPEVIREEGYGRSADIWSLGMSILEMATGAPPWPTAANAVYKLAMTDDIPELPDHLSDEAKDFLDGCFQRDPIRRPEAKLMEDHDFLSDSEDPKLLESIQSNVVIPCGDDATFETADFGASEVFAKSTQSGMMDQRTGFTSMRESDFDSHDQNALEAALRSELQDQLDGCDSGWCVHPLDHQSNPPNDI